MDEHFVDEPIADLPPLPRFDTIDELVAFSLRCVAGHGTALNFREMLSSDHREINRQRCCNQPVIGSIATMAVEGPLHLQEFVSQRRGILVARLGVVRAVACNGLHSGVLCYNR